VDDGKIVGYSVLLISPHLHYAETVFAMVDVIFLCESHRKTRAGLFLINKTEEFAKEAGAHVLTYHTKPNHNTIEKILYYKGFGHMENIIGKYVG